MSLKSTKERGRHAPTYAVVRISDNRFNGLLREIHEALQGEDDPETLRKVGQSLKMIGDRARSRSFNLTGEY